MKDLLDLILKNITTHPDDVSLEESDDNGITLYTVTVNPEDMGRVIGKDGKVIRAIRSLAHVIAVRQNKRFRIKLADVAGENGEGNETEEADNGKPIDAPAAKEATGDDVIEGAFDVTQNPTEK